MVHPEKSRAVRGNVRFDPTPSLSRPHFTSARDRKEAASKKGSWKYESQLSGKARRRLERKQRNKE